MADHLYRRRSSRLAPAATADGDTPVRCALSHRTLARVQQQTHLIPGLRLSRNFLAARSIVLLGPPGLLLAWRCRPPARAYLQSGARARQLARTLPHAASVSSRHHGERAAHELRSMAG